MTSTEMENLVREYAAGKSAQDVDRALAVCDESFVIDTIPFGTRSRDRAETAAHLHVFFSVFPDYGASVEDIVVGEHGVASTGMATMTMRGPLLDVAPTGRTASVPFVSVFGFRNGKIAVERFFFDLASLCDQLGVAVDAMRAALATFNATSNLEAHA